MKIILVLLLALTVLQGCVTLNPAPEVRNQTVIDGKDFKKLKLPNQHLFVLNNPRKMIHFRNYMAQKHKLDNYTFTDVITVNIDGTEFKMYVHTPKFTERTFNLISAVLDKDTSDDYDEDGMTRDEHTSETDYNYVAISFFQEEEDCLSIDSIFYNLATSYLKEMSKEYLSFYEG